MSKLVILLTTIGFIGLFIVGGIFSALSGKSFTNTPTSVLGSKVQKYAPMAQPIKASATATPKAVKPSDKSLRLVTYIFSLIKGNQKSEFINKFSNGKNDLSLAVNNLALLLA